VWGWYQWRIAMVEQAQPNAGHRALADLERLKAGLVVVTQNVDDLHERAGSRNVVLIAGARVKRRSAEPRASDGPPRMTVRTESTRRSYSR
jgi:NAD-dependent deacetylase